MQAFSRKSFVYLRLVRYCFRDNCEAQEKSVLRSINVDFLRAGGLSLSKGKIGDEEDDPEGV